MKSREVYSDEFNDVTHEDGKRRGERVGSERSKSNPIHRSKKTRNLSDDAESLSSKFEKSSGGGKDFKNLFCWYLKVLGDNFQK